MQPALIALAREMATSPETILQKLADTALTVCRAGSAGLSLLEDGDQRARFHWRASGRLRAGVAGRRPLRLNPAGGRSTASAIAGRPTRRNRRPSARDAGIPRARVRGVRRSHPRGAGQRAGASAARGQHAGPVGEPPGRTGRRRARLCRRAGGVSPRVRRSAAACAGLAEPAAGIISRRRLPGVEPAAALPVRHPRCAT